MKIHWSGVGLSGKIRDRLSPRAKLVFSKYAAAYGDHSRAQPGWMAKVAGVPTIPGAPPPPVPWTGATVADESKWYGTPVVLTPKPGAPVGATARTAVLTRVLNRGALLEVTREDTPDDRLASPTASDTVRISTTDYDVRPADGWVTARSGGNPAKFYAVHHGEVIWSGEATSLAEAARTLGSTGLLRDARLHSPAVLVGPDAVRGLYTSSMGPIGSTPIPEHQATAARGVVSASLMGVDAHAQAYDDAIAAVRRAEDYLVQAEDPEVAQVERVRTARAALAAVQNAAFDYASTLGTQNHRTPDTARNITSHDIIDMVEASPLRGFLVEAWQRAATVLNQIHKANKLAGQALAANQDLADRLRELATEARRHAADVPGSLDLDDDKYRFTKFVEQTAPVRADAARVKRLNGPAVEEVEAALDEYNEAVAQWKADIGVAHAREQATAVTLGPDAFGRALLASADFLQACTDHNLPAALYQAKRVGNFAKEADRGAIDTFGGTHAAPYNPDAALEIMGQTLIANGQSEAWRAWYWTDDKKQSLDWMTAYCKAVRYTFDNAEAFPTWYWMGLYRAVLSHGLGVVAGWPVGEPATSARVDTARHDVLANLADNVQLQPAGRGLLAVAAADRPAARKFVQTMLERIGQAECYVGGLDGKPGIRLAGPAARALDAYNVRNALDNAGLHHAGRLGKMTVRTDGDRYQAAAFIMGVREEAMGGDVLVLAWTPKMFGVPVLTVSPLTAWSFSAAQAATFEAFKGFAKAIGYGFMPGGPARLLPGLATESGFVFVERAGALGEAFDEIQAFAASPTFDKLYLLSRSMQTVIQATTDYVPGGENDDVDPEIRKAATFPAQAMLADAVPAAILAFLETWKAAGLKNQFDGLGKAKAPRYASGTTARAFGEVEDIVEVYVSVLKAPSRYGVTAVNRRVAPKLAKLASKWGLWLDKAAMKMPDGKAKAAVEEAGIQLVELEKTLTR